MNPNRRVLPWLISLGALGLGLSLWPAGEAATRGPTPASVARGAELYARYCALCHGAEREGYAADNAPSLRSPELMGLASPGFLWGAVAWGRPGTPMAAFFADQGGPIDHDDMHALLEFLGSEAGVSRQSLPEVPVEGDLSLGAAVYARECAGCHGAKGEGGTGTALGNPVTLATASDAFLRETVARGRTGTPMPAFADRLTAAELDGVTAFLRSRALGWSAPPPVRVRPPALAQAVLYPSAPPARLSTREGRFVAADQVRAELEAGRRLVLLDARPLSDWQRGHIPGALPVPFYDGVEAIAPHLPDDETWIVVYCACPHAASGKIVDALRARGFERAVVLDEGVLVWASRGYPLALGGS